MKGKRERHALCRTELELLPRGQSIIKPSLTANPAPRTAPPRSRVFSGISSHGFYRPDSPQSTKRARSLSPRLVMGVSPPTGSAYAGLPPKDRNTRWRRPRTHKAGAQDGGDNETESSLGTQSYNHVALQRPLWMALETKILECHLYTISKLKYM